jgi:hypothetical protein
MHLSILKQIVATLALGSRPRQRGLQGCGPRGSPGVTQHVPESVWKCEGMNPHTPKATPILGDGVLVDSRIFKGLLLEEFLISLESPWNIDVQNGLAWPIWTSETQVMAKRKAKNQIGNLTPDH